MLYFCNFQNASQSKQPANGRKFAQSGHPAESYNEFGGGGQIHWVKWMTAISRNKR
jgi:hypothetical protein